MEAGEWIAFGGLAFTLVAAIVAVAVRFAKVETKQEAMAEGLSHAVTVPELVQRVDSVEQRLKEDRDKNTEQHKELYEFRREIEPQMAEILQQLINIVSTQNRILDDIEETKRIVRDLPSLDRRKP
jgi:septal ring factor EnvC (AmiA/AmiB activator)